MFTEKYNSLLKEAINDFASNINATGKKDLLKRQYTVFYPFVGKEYLKNTELLVYGQATRDWGDAPDSTIIRFTSGEAKDKLNDIVNGAIEWAQPANDGECPLEWVNQMWDEGLKSSFFWNVAYKLAEQQYNRTDENWNYIVAYSNLMRIAPFGFGNPNGWEIEAQENFAAKLFIAEIEELKPKTVLLLTNLKSWAEPILEKAGIAFTRKSGQYIQAVGNYNGSKIIVTKRPFIGGKHQPFVDAIRKQINFEVKESIKPAVQQVTSEVVENVNSIEQ